MTITDCLPLAQPFRLLFASCLSQAVTCLCDLSLQDYIHFSLARHSFSLHHLPDAKHAFESLLSHESAQSPNQQLLNLKEFIFVYKVGVLGGEGVML